MVARWRGAASHAPLAITQAALFATLLCLAVAAQVHLENERQQSKRSSGNDTELVVTAVLPGGSSAGSALAALTAAVLRRAGRAARAAPPPPACRPPAAPDARACRDATFAALAAGGLHVALLPVPAAAAPVAWPLRDYGLDVFGDAVPPARRACLRFASTEPGAPQAGSASPARSLLDLADEDVARQYEIPPQYLHAIFQSSDELPNLNEFFEPPWCSGANASCAVVLTSDAGEAGVLLAAALRLKLRVRALPLHRRLAAAARLFAAAPPPRPLLCDWAPEWTELATVPTALLGPPPCATALRQSNDGSADCPFESLRLMKFANVRAIARSTATVRALVRLRLDGEETCELTERARSGRAPEAAAEDFLKAHPKSERRSEVRVVVMVPRATARQAHDAHALAAAAQLAEAHLEAAGAPRAARFKVELFDDRCDVRQAYRYMFAALGAGEYGSLSAMAGPACAAAFAEVARQSAAHALPLLAYSPQRVARGAAALLAAGDASDAAAALSALAQRLRWRRLAALSEPAARAALDASRLQVPLVHHLELPDPLPEDDGQIFHDWARRVAASGARVVVVAAEDARVVRAALCAGARAGLAPGAGAVWLLPGALPAGWLRARPGDRPACAQRDLDDVADGHLSFAAEWLAVWRDEAAALPPEAVDLDDDADTMHSLNARAEDQDLQNITAAWRQQWATRCAAWARRSTGAGVGVGADEACSVEAAGAAALLYDVLRLWAGALDRVLAAQPARLADLHDPDSVRSLVENATEAEYVGLTGRFRWAREGAGAVRVAPLLLLQWENGSRRAVGRWRRASPLLLGAPRWRTPGGAPPGDGGDDSCALRPLAQLLRADCRAAGVALAALLLVLAMAVLAAAALHCKRRAERECRARLAALALRPVTPARDGLDRWEVPRERVVINRKLGMGAFGTVYGGHALLGEARTWTAVAVKTLKAGATTEEKLDFLSEAEAMKRFDHKNIVRLLAVVTKTEPVCTVMEFMLYGDLKNYLLARRHLALAGEGEGEGEGGAADEVSARRLTAMAGDAARALAYLARLRYVHRDVAARNCLVSARRVLKLADFGMTRLVFENDYYRFSRKGMLPVRWMAPESLALGVFSAASDVWSFGVLLYEMVTFGSLPFQGLSNAEVLARVKAGHTLDLPHDLAPPLEALIKSCWQREQRARPSAAELAARLGSSPRLLAPCLDVPLDALPLPLPDEPPWRAPPDRAAARWLSWAAPHPSPHAAPDPASAHTDTTYLSSEPRDTDRFLPLP